MANGESVFLREVEGDHQIEVEFSGSLLPGRGVEIGGEQHLATRHYPGNMRRAATQVMGPREDPIELRGVLRDAWIGAGGGALEAMQRIDLIRRRGRYCELAWGEVFVVRGYLRRAKFPIQRDDDIEYQIEFQVDERMETAMVFADPHPEPGPDDLRGRVKGLGAAMKALDAALALNNVLRAVL